MLNLKKIVNEIAEIKINDKIKVPVDTYEIVQPSNNNEDFWPTQE